MYRKTLIIESEPSQEGQKSRAFSVELLAYVLANEMWELGGGGKSVLRPVFLAYAGTEQASRAFSANLRSGRCAATEGTGSASTRFEVPRSAGFRFETFNRARATLTLAYLPGVFSFQPPSSESDEISFLCMPPAWWVEEQALGAEAREAVLASYFVAYLDQRSPLPIANDPLFHRRLYRAALEEPWCPSASGTEGYPGSFFHIGLEGIGFLPPVACRVDSPTFAQFLRAQTANHLPLEQETLDHGTPTVRRPRRLLPHSVRAAAGARLAG